MSSLRWCSSRQGSESTHDHHSPGLPSLFGEHWRSLCRGHQPPFCLSSFLMLLHCSTLQTSSDLCQGTLPSVPGELAGLCGGRGSAQEEETRNKVLLPSAAFPSSTASRSLSLGHPYLGDSLSAWSEVSLRGGTPVPNASARVQSQLVRIPLV